MYLCIAKDDRSIPSFAPNQDRVKPSDMGKENKNLNRIKVVLAEKNLQNKWLAEQIGRDQATVSKWVTNSAQPSLDMLIKIAKVLKVDIGELVRIDDETSES